MGSQSMAGMEVHVPGSDAVKWIEISVPPSSYYPPPPPPISTSTASPPPPPISTSTATDSSPQQQQQQQQQQQHTFFFAPRTEDASSCQIIGDPSTYVIWRIHKKRPNVLELMEFSACNEFPKIGLRLLFPDALCPFAFICQNQAQSTTAPNPYLLYTLTVSGVAFLLQLQTVLYYASCSIFPQIQLRELNLQAHSQSQTITSVAATLGCLFIGRYDGSICCFQLGLLNQSAPGFMHELRDDAGIGSLWGLMSRGKTIEPVQDLVISELQGRKLLFALQGDENLRVWELLSRTSVLNQTIGIPKSTGTSVSRLWVGDANPYAHLISLVILYKNNMDGDKFIAICSLRVSLGVKINLVLEPSTKIIPLQKGRIIDVKIACNKLWIFRNRVLLMCDDFHNFVNLREVKAYSMQESFINEQLFQDSEHSADGLIWASDSLFSSVKDQVVPFVSSIFLRRLFHPRVFQNVIFRTTLQDFNKHWTDSEFQSLSVDDLKREILSHIESEGIAENLISLIDFWKNVCTRYYRYWCKINTPYGLLVDTSTGVIGLIRHNSLSIFRCLEDIELLRYGSIDHFGVFVGSGLDLIDDLDREILLEFLRCISSIHQQLGKAAFAIFYESLVSEPMISSEDVVPCFLKILETGYSSSVAAIHAAELGDDTAWMNKLADHKNQRKFSIEMLLSLHSLFDKAGTWSRVLNVIENFLKFLVPRKSIQKLDLEVSCNINTSLLVHSTSQIASEMFKSTLDILLLLGYLVNMSGQVYMVQDDISKIQLELVPMIQEILMEWFILHFLGTTPSRSPAMEDFSSQLSSLHIANNADKRSRNDKKLGTSDFTLAFVLFPNFQSSSEDQVFLSSRSLPGPNNIINSVRNFISWIIWGRTGEESSAFFSHSTELAMILLKHGQYEAVENLFAIIDAHSRKEKTSQSIQSADGDWCTHLHLLGFGLLARAHFELHGISKEMKVREAVRCFFRAASGSGASQALQSLSFQGLPHPDHSDCASTAAWKLHYYQWAMQTFEQYNMSEGACQFALAALEQVDEVLGSKDDNNGGDSLSEPATTIRGRLWANVFKFKLDLNHYNDAYCAIISNPDEDSKHICLRRFIIVLCERGAVKTLCDGQLPFVGLMEKVEKELAWKAERSDITAKPNPYKLLYAFEMHRHNWRRAASYIYRYSSRLRSELALKEQHQLSMALQESLNGLSATINALNLVHPAYAWIDPQFVGSSCMDERYPNKKARTVNEDNYLCNSNAQSSRVQCCIDIEKLENEFIITSAQYLLTTANIKLKFTGNKTLPSDLVDLLVQGNFYDMAFTILLKFRKASRLERELERVFVAISLKCFPNMGNDFRTQGLMLTSSKDEAFFHSPIDKSPTVHQSKGDSHWETLELYLEKYKKLHPRLPVIVAETLLHTDPQIELPLWLVDMFKGGRKATGWGMTGQESDPASLLRLYVDYGRFTEATNLLLEYIQSFSSLRPLDITNRKKMSAVWFPYTTIERLWCQLDELRSSGHMTDQCDKLQKLLHGALLNYLKQIKVDSDDVISSAQINEDLNDGVSAAQG